MEDLTSILNASFNFRPLNREELDVIYKSLPQLNTSGKPVTLQESAQQVLDWITGKSRFVSNSNEFNKFFIQYINEAIKVNVMTYNTLIISEYTRHPGVNIDLTTNLGIDAMNALLENGSFNTDVYLVYADFIRNIKLHIAALSYILSNPKINPILSAKLPFDSINTRLFITFTNTVTYEDMFKNIDDIINTTLAELLEINSDIKVIDLCLFSAILTNDFEGYGNNYNFITFGILKPQPTSKLEDQVLSNVLDSEYNEKVGKQK